MAIVRVTSNPTPIEAEGMRLRDALAGAGYTSDAVLRLLGPDAYETGRDWVPVHARRLPADGLGAVVRLLFLGVPTAARVLPIDAGLLVGAGLATAEGGTILPTARVVPHADLLIASDPYSRGIDDPPDYVAGYTDAAATCAHLVPRATVDSALDLGTGCGVQALLIARHARRVVATDVNPRALAFAAFNAKLNGLENVEPLFGSGLEPVAGDRFDLIVCNAPYVVSPELRYAYRDAGVRGDGFSELIVRETPAHLRDRGIAVLLVAWLRTPGDSWEERPGAWAASSGCDAWLLAGQYVDALTHAARWNERESGDPERFASTLDRWLAEFARLGAEGVTEGAILLRRRDGAATWTRADTVPRNAPLPASAHILRTLAARDATETLDDNQLLGLRLALTESALLEPESAERARLRLRDGLLFAVEFDLLTAGILRRLDGSRSVSEALVEVDAPAGVAGQVVPILRELIELGFLEVGP